MKKTLLFTAVVSLLTCGFLFAKPKKADYSSGVKVVASTSWTAAFADIAGADQVDVIAPANLRHPPEYEVTVGDIQKIHESNYFIYAGFERMMKTFGDSVGKTEMVKIRCDNSVENVLAQTKKIADLLGTQEICEKRIKDFLDAEEYGKKTVTKKGLKEAKVLCNVNQIYLAKDLGFEVAGTFGPGPVTADQIADAKTGNYVLIIDNVHNPVGTPLAEVAPEAKYVIWRNFPEKVERGALVKVIKANIDTL